MKKLNLTIILAALTLCSAAAQTISSPKLVTLTNVFAWNDPNVPPAVGYTVYATPAGSTGITHTVSTTTTNLVLSQLLPVARQTTTYTLTVLGWDSAGESSEPSTNYVVLVPRQKLKGMGNLRVP